MTGGRRAPGPVLLLGLAAIVVAFADDHPLVLTAAAAGALALLAAAPGRPGRWFVIGGLVSGLSLALLNPFVAAEGDLILWQGPEVAVIDLEVTAEEIAAGLAIGLRLFAVAVLVGAVLAQIDADRLQAQVARVAPRSALTCALAARLMPTLERDARAIAETARLRGVDLATGGWSGRARRAAPLALPLLASSLERGLDIAEAMAARGYGAGPRTRLPERPYDRAEWGVLALGGALAVAAIAALVLGLAPYSYYPTLDPVLAPGAVALAAVVAGALGGAALVLRRSP
ncbi:MAG TPA: energy-coupling factor transporter transmembrane component T [Miltoncostaeaceae bacterium]|nr:energy-coupling factor transporter transmembrane component T [Miltoncostaeaceae bacterium]